MKKIIATFYPVILALSLLCCYVVAIAATPSWNIWLSQLKVEAVDQGIDPLFFDQTFHGVHPSQQVIHFDHTQPEKRLTYFEYRNSRASKYRIALGKKNYQKYRAILSDIGRHYGVNPAYIVAIWGMETSYGSFMGTFPVIQALATLAYDSPRKDYFRSELLVALHILAEGHVAPEKFKGEWAGASGHPQFMPSSWDKYAQDYNHDGRKDIWSTHADAFASIANYLKEKGWKIGEPVKVPVVISGYIDSDLLTVKQEKTVREWEKLGVHAAKGASLPSGALQASLVEPYGGPYFLVFNNFKVLMRYNNSIYYAGTISYIADAIVS